MEPFLTPSAALSCIEVEMKYSVSPASSLWKDSHRLQREVLTVLAGAGCACSPPAVIDQTDHYFDTPGGALSGRACTLRLRLKHRAGAAPAVAITCKRPVSGSCSTGSAGQMERYEYTEALERADIASPAAIRFIRQYLGGLAAPADLTETILIENKRTKYDIKYPFPDGGSGQEESYELAFDSVRYLNRANGNIFEEQQIELELKSAPAASPHLQQLTRRLEEALPCLTVMTESKYVRARRFTR